MDVNAVRHAEFREALRGYHRDDVDEFVDRVCDLIEDLQERLDQADLEASKAAQQRGETSETLQRTLLMAQRAADSAVEEARQRASAIVTEADERAAELRASTERDERRRAEEVEQRYAQEVHTLEARRDALTAEVQVLEGHLERERLRLRAALTEQLRRLDAGLAPTVDASGEATQAVAAVEPSVTVLPGSTPVGGTTGGGSNGASNGKATRTRQTVGSSSAASAVDDVTFKAVFSTDR